MLILKSFFCILLSNCINPLRWFCHVSCGWWGQCLTYGLLFLGVFHFLMSVLPSKFLWTHIDSDLRIWGTWRHIRISTNKIDDLLYLLIFTVLFRVIDYRIAKNRYHSTRGTKEGLIIVGRLWMFVIYFIKVYATYLSLNERSI